MSPEPEARFIPVTSDDATAQADRERLNRENRERSYRRFKGLPEPAPVPAVTPKSKARTKLVVKTSPAPRPVVGSSPSGAGVPQPRRGEGPGSRTPPGADEVRMSRREYEAVAKLIDAQPWSKSGKRGSVGRKKS